ncbi:MAG TPA: SiaB family protein kinase [Flavobacteriales bacterium]|nr:SiaB family protein kinase [Flavobacteriales bacterium]HNU55117.1 SiaB family protein kinase [Flavobacteriales bacterium]
MDPAHVLALYERFAGDRSTFLYGGAFLDEHTARLINMQEEHLESEGASRVTRGKLTFVLVEAYQNIVRHRVKDAAMLKGAGHGLFLLRSAGTSHEVTAMNAVAGAEVEALQKALDRLSGLDLGEMKRLFLRGLQNEARTERGGAGLGLVEMARRSGNPLRHAFTRIDERYQLFALQVLVGPDDGWLSDGSLPMDLHRAVLDDRILLLHRGELPAVVQENLIRMIERDMSELQAGPSRADQAFLLMMGAVADLGVGGEGPMVIVAQGTDHATITLAAPLTVATVGRVEKAIERVLTMDGPSLQRRYRDALLGRADGAGGLELGLMDLARRSIGPLRTRMMSWRELPLLVLEADV